MDIKGIFAKFLHVPVEKLETKGKQGRSSESLDHPPEDFNHKNVMNVISENNTAAAINVPWTLVPLKDNNLDSASHNDLVRKIWVPVV